LVSNVTYLPFGPLNILTFGNGRSLTKAYDQNYRIASVADSVGSNPLSQVFTLNAVGDLTGLTERTGASTTVSRTYTYDGLDRLTAQKNGATNVEAFTYDPTGDRLSKTAGTTKTYTYSPTSHRLTAVGSVSRTYLAAGETDVVGTGLSKTDYNYDERHRLTGIASSTNPVSYQYNGLGQRVSKKAGQLAATLTQYVYDESGHLLGEYTNAGTRLKEYVWLDDTIVAVLNTFDGSTYQFVETDQLGTPRAVVHPTKNVIAWRWDMNPTAFGEHDPNKDPDSDAVNYVLNLRFPGQYFDSESGLNYNYFRDFERTTGRYIQSDPLGLAAGVSTYAYVGSNPLGALDPLGLARFGFRPLGDGSSVLTPGQVPDGSSNIHKVHEQLWFDDYASDNAGFFAGTGSRPGFSMCGEQGVVRNDEGHSRSQYSFFGPVYDDGRMRQALENIGPNWVDSSYCLVGRNCQDFADALRAEYSRLLLSEPPSRGNHHH
jgi:RHS repeat-associated protein